MSSTLFHDNPEICQLRSRKPHDEHPRLANMVRLRGCCRIVCARQATTIFVIMLLIARALKATCSTKLDQEQMHNHHNHTQQHRHQQTNQPTLLNLTRANTNMSLSPNLQLSEDSHQPHHDQLQKQQQQVLAHRSGHSGDVMSNRQVAAKRTPEVGHAYDSLEGLGEFIKLMLDELELHDGANKLQRVNENDSSNDLSDVEEFNQRHSWPRQFMGEQIYQGDLIPFVRRSAGRNKRDIIMADDIAMYDDNNSNNKGKNKFRNNNVTIKIENNRIPSNHQRLGQETNGPQMIKSVMPMLNETHMRMVMDNSIKQDHLYDEQGGVNLVATSVQPVARKRAKGVSIKLPSNRATTSTAASTASQTTTAPDLFNLTTRKGKKQSIKASPSAEPDLPEAGEVSTVGETEDFDSYEPMSMTSPSSYQLDSTAAAAAAAAAGEPLNQNDNTSPGGTYESSAELSPQVEPINFNQHNSTGRRKSKNSHKKANLIYANDDTVTAQPPMATSMPSPSRQVPPPEQNPLKEMSLRRQSVQNYNQQPAYNEATYNDDKINSYTVFDNPEEFDDSPQNTKTPSSSNLAQPVPSLSDLSGSMVDPNQVLSELEQLKQRRTNLTSANQLSTVPDNDVMLDSVKNGLMQILQNAEYSNGLRKPKKPIRKATATDNNNNNNNNNAYKPNHQQVNLDSSDMEQLVKSHLLNSAFRLSAPYAAFNHSSSSSSPEPTSYTWPTSENHLQHLLPNSQSIVRDQPSSQYDNQFNNEEQLNTQPMVYPPVGAVSIQPHSSPVFTFAQPHQFRAIPEGVRAKLEESFYNSISNNQQLKHGKRALASSVDLKAAQLNRFVRHKPYRHSQSANLIPNTAPLSQYLNQAKSLQAANSYMSPTRNDPLQDSSQAEGGFQGVAPSMVSQNQVLGMLRAGPVVPSLTGGQQQSPPAQLVRRALPLAAQITRGRLPTTAYLLSAYPSAGFPYSSTTSRYTRHNAAGPSQRLWNSSPHRIGRLASSSSINDDSAAVAAATSDPMWSDTQTQEDDYQQAPQTIQITAVPNGGLGVNNGFNNLAGGWNGWNGGPWNGRQVLLVNRQPSAEWRNWILPVAAVLSLPLILGSLLVPVFLKSVMFLIQILQMLGFLMPPGQLAGQISSLNHSQAG